MLPKQPSPIKIAYLYVSEDKNIYDALYKHLGILERDNLIQQLSEVLGGADRQEKMKKL